jgi:broad specificity phosphatase PhoE
MIRSAFFLTAICFESSLAVAVEQPIVNHGEPIRIQRIVLVRHGTSTWTSTHKLPWRKQLRGEEFHADLHVERDLQRDTAEIDADTSGYRDAPLCKEGQRQAHALSEVFRTRHTLNNIHSSLMSQIQLVVSSPLSRALETASILTERSGLTVVADADCRELPTTPQDVGSTKYDLEDRFPQVNFNNVGDGRWWSGADDTGPSLAQRVHDFKTRLAHQKADVILAVSHREFIRHFLSAGIGFKFTECGVMEVWLTTLENFHPVSISNQMKKQMIHSKCR